MTDYLETMQQFGRDRFDAATAASASLAKEFGSVVEETQNYSKKSFEDAQAYFKQLLNVKSVDEAVKLHTSFVDTARHDFIDQANKYGELYFNFAKTLLRSGNGVGASFADEGFQKSKST